MSGRVARGTVLVDTNTIIESHRTGAWRGLAGGYRVETVEDCVTETQTGFQLRRPEPYGHDSLRPKVGTSTIPSRLP